MEGDGSTKAVVGDQSELGQEEEAASAAGPQSAAHDLAPSKQDATGAEVNDEMEAVELDDAPAVVAASPAAASPGQATTHFSSPPEVTYDSRATAAETIRETGLASTSSTREGELVLGDVRSNANGPESRERPGHARDVDTAPPVRLDAPAAAAASGDHLTQPAHRTSHSSASGEDDGPVSPTVAFGVVLVGFHHSLGPIVDCSYPPSLKEDDDIVKNLPFLALPDGAHLRDEDYSCFHLYLPSISRQTVYGISCIRQLRSDELLNRTPDITRTTVQKAVVVLASKPVFGPIRDKLGVITRAFFAQRDFEDTEILRDFHTSLQHALKDEDQTSEAAIYMSISLREFVHRFRMQTLSLLKLLLLQRKVMFYGAQVERLVSFQYALISLVPLLLMHLEDAASPLLESRAFIAKKPSSLKTSDRRSLLSFIGLPLNLFGIDSFFQPYLPLQQLEVLQTAHSYLVGTTNSIFQSQRDCKIDAIVNIDNATIEFRDSQLGSLVTLTAADRKWMDDIVKTIDSSWNVTDPGRPSGMGFKASDDWLRFKFEEYVCSTLSAIKFVDFLKTSNDARVLVNTTDPTGLSSFNESWLAAFRKTHAFEVWDRNTDPVIFDLVEPRHPCEGQAHIIEDVGIRLANGLHDLHLDERLGPAQDAINKGLATGSEGVWNFYTSVKADLSKRQEEYRQRKAREEKESGASGGERPDASRDRSDAGQARDTTQPAPGDVAGQVLAGAAEVGGRAASLASSFGSFLGSRLSKQKSQTFNEPSATAPVTSGKSSLDFSNAADVGGEPVISKPHESVGQPVSKTSSFFSAWRQPAAPAIVAERASDDVAGSAIGVPSAACPPGRAFPVSAGFGSLFRRTSGSSMAPAPLPVSIATGAPQPGPSHHDSTLGEYEDVSAIFQIRDLDAEREQASSSSPTSTSSPNHVDSAAR